MTLFNKIAFWALSSFMCCQGPKTFDFGFIPTITFDDVVGCKEQKNYFLPCIDSLIHPEKYPDQNPCKCILLVGAPGIGKSVLAEAVGGQLFKTLKNLGRNSTEIGFFPVHAGNIATSGFPAFTKFVQAHAPCIFVIDDIDLLDPYELISCIAAIANLCAPNKRIILIGITHDSSFIHPVLKQKDGFTTHIYLELPSEQEREEYLRREFVKQKLSVADFDFAYLATQTSGCTFEDLQRTIRATILKTQTTRHSFTQTLFEQCLKEKFFDR